LTDAELLLLGLIAEMPRHGYEIDRVIEQRAGVDASRPFLDLLRARRLQKLRLVAAQKAARPHAGTKSRRVFAVTPAGRRALIATIAALGNLQPTYSSVLLGMINWSVLERAQALKALQTRSRAIQAELARLCAIQVERQPLPDFVEALFEHSIGQLRAEATWVTETPDYMSRKPACDSLPGSG
jgi:DNA-binding PadR family transcriptional regulator